MSSKLYKNFIRSRLQNEIAFKEEAAKWAGNDEESSRLSGGIYNINGGEDYQTNYLIEQDYFEVVNAPRKELYIMEDTTHDLLELKSEEFRS